MADENMQKSRVNFGIIGTGNIAGSGHGRAFATTSNANLLSVYSRDLSRARGFAQEHGAARAFSSLDEMLKDPELDAVIITSPDRLHFEHALVVAKAGKHILLEKPMVTEFGQGEKLISLCTANHLKLAIAYHLRHHAGHQQLVAYARSGQLGRIIHVRALWSWQAYDNSNWRASSELGKWWSLAGVGTHCLDLVRWILVPCAGEVEMVSAVASNAVYQGPHDELAILSLRFTLGATAEICSSSVFAAPTRLEVYGTAGYVIAEDTFGRHGAGKIWSNKGEVHFVPQNPFVEQLESFSRSLLFGVPLAVDGEEGMKNAYLLIEAAKAATFLKK